MRGVQALKKQAPPREKACFVRAVYAQALTPKILQLKTKTHILVALFVGVLCRFSLTIDIDQRTAKGVSMSLGKRVQTAAQRVGLEQAQIARREMRRSPVEQHRLHVKTVLRWTHAWSQTTRKILLLVTGSSKSNFLSKLVEDGYMRCEKVLGRTFWALNKSGVDLLRAMSPEGDAVASLSGSRHINLHAFAHNQLAQQVIAAKLHAGGDGCRWMSERELRASIKPSEPGSKVPDGAFINANGFTTFIEVERSRKAVHDLEAMLLNLARLLESDSKSCCEIYIEPGIAERYISTLKGWLRSRSFRAWSETADGELFLSGENKGVYLLTDSLQNAMERITFIKTKVEAL